MWYNIGMASSCSIKVNNDGTVNLIEGSADIGGTRASIAMQAAEVLGLRAEEVLPTVVDTDSIGYTATTDGSRTTFATGWAAYEAAQSVKRQVEERAAAVWGVEPDSVELVEGVVRSKTDESLQMTFGEVAPQMDGTGGPIMGSAVVHPRGIGPSSSGNIVDVQVDPETGKVDILRYTAFQDAGKAIHPTYVEGQMQGGSVQGLGWALNEEYYYDENGVMKNGSFLDYRMPISLDVPMIDTVIVEVPNPGTSVRSERRRRVQYHPSRTGYCQRHLSRDGRPHEHPSHEPGHDSGPHQEGQREIARSMATVYIPSLMRDITSQAKLQVSGSTVRQIVDNLEQAYPGLRDRLIENNRLRESISVVVDGEVTPIGLLEKVGEDSEVHFVPAIAGGNIAG